MSKAKVILGIGYGSHDSSAAVMVEGKLKAAIEQERINLVKHTEAFPLEAAKACLASLGLSMADVDLVAHCTNFPNSEVLQKNHGGNLETYRDEISANIAFQLSYSGKIVHFNHHRCHLASSYYASGFKDAVVASYDGVGESLSMLVACARNGNILVPEDPTIEAVHPDFPEPIYRVKYPDSLGMLYAAFTHHLGFRPLEDEGIVMGLASYGDPLSSIHSSSESLTYSAMFEHIIQDHGPFKFSIHPDWQTFLYPDAAKEGGIEYEPVWEWKKKGLDNSFGNLLGPRRDKFAEVTLHHKNIAAGLQKRIECIILRDIEQACKQYNLNNVCMAGGLALNCSVNGKLISTGCKKEVYVPAAPGDSGLAVGACFLAWKQLNPDFIPIKHNDYLLGPKFDRNEIIKAIEATPGISFVEYQKEEELYIHAAAALAKGQVIGFYQGGSEFGPRALGNRSILSAPYPVSQKEYINKYVKFREYFRPLAPAVLLEHASTFFQLDQESPHMLYAVPAVNDSVEREKVIATLHVDGTARVQTVTQELNPEFHALISKFYKITGVPVLMNTSFNVKGQPIVNNPTQALQCFLETNLNILVIGSFICVKNIANKFVEKFVAQPDYYARFAAIEEHDTFFLKELTRLNLLNEEVTSILSIGSGEGSMELGIASKWPHVSVTCVDPSPSYSDSLTEKVRQTGLTNVSIHCQTFEAFHSHAKYDLIVAVHSWYAFGENKEMLKKAMSFLNPGGSFAIIVQEHQAIAHALTLFNESLDYHNVTASEFAKWLTQNGYPSTKCVRLSHWIPSDTFLSASGALNQSGADYASFLVARPYTALPESKQVEIQQTFVQKTEEGKINLACGLILVQS